MGNDGEYITAGPRLRGRTERWWCMPKTPPDGSDVPDDAESQFLTALWDNLEQAQEIAVAREVLDRLDEVLKHCEVAAAAIRDWLAQSR